MLWIQWCFVAIWWFHPLAWILNLTILRLREQCCDDLVIIEKLDRPGANLISLLENTSWVILIDAMQGSGQPGRIQRLSENDWPTYSQGFSSHGLGVLNALSLARALDSLPPRLDLYGIEIGSATLGDGPGSEVQSAAWKLAGIVAADLDCFLCNSAG